MKNVIRLPRCPEQLSDNGRTYFRCARPVHGGYCWTPALGGVAWLVAGESQDRHRAPAPSDCLVPIPPGMRRQRPAAGRQRGVRRAVVPDPSGRRKVGTRNAGRARKPGRRSG